MTTMKITLALQADSDNAHPGHIVLRRGSNRPHNLVIELDNPERLIEVDSNDARQSIAILNGQGILSFIERLRDLQRKARSASEWDSIQQTIKIAEREA